MRMRAKQFTSQMNKIFWRWGVTYPLESQVDHAPLMPIDNSDIIIIHESNSMINVHVLEMVQ
jgi:hypothetical protein